MLSSKSVTLAIQNEIGNLCEAKGIKLDNYSQISEREFRDINSSTGLFVYNGNANGEKVIVMYMPSGSRYIKKENFVNYITNNKADRYIVIFSEKKDIKVEGNIQFINGAEKMIGDQTGYMKANRISVRILSEEERNHYLSTLFIFDPNKFCRINSNETMILYSQAKPGDVVEILYPSHSSSLITGNLYLVE